MQAAPEFNSNETNKHKIPCVVIQATSKFNISHKARPGTLKSGLPPR
ncbi:hypothetical protein CAMGR0001_1389 [Campylobacter gracilis RM3268]|uniref:Uncharacterized protein n=1 Tax=Campylobacter gracilis RM3268 TaxID=553220 RepID=C8PJI9_9BACT|nr:hypothetical protein CAMGR0001_1389 [Campylobacter gracilis RM3268]